MRKCPDEETLTSYLDYRLSTENWNKVRGHCYFCDKCKKIVSVVAKAISLRRNRLGLSQREKQSEGVEALRLGLLLQPPNDPEWENMAKNISMRLGKNKTIRGE
jgi:hypothetical protein